MHRFIPYFLFSFLIIDMNAWGAATLFNKKREASFSSNPFPQKPPKSRRLTYVTLIKPAIPLEDEENLSPNLPNYPTTPVKRALPQKLPISPTSLGTLTPVRINTLKKAGVNTPEIKKINALSRASRKLTSTQSPSKATRNKSIVQDLFSVSEEESQEETFQTMEELEAEREFFEEVDILKATYKSLNPHPIIRITPEYRRVIDKRIFITLGFNRQIIGMLEKAGIAGTYPRELYYPVSTFLDDDQRRHLRRELEQFMLKLNTEIPTSLGATVDIFAFEQSVFNPLVKYIKKQKQLAKTDNAYKRLDIIQMNMVLHGILKQPIENGLYAFMIHPDGYLWVYPTCISKQWKNIDLKTNEMLTKDGKSPVDPMGRYFEAHHGAKFDALTEKSYDTLWHKRLKAKRESVPDQEMLSHEEIYTDFSLEDMFSYLCVVVVMSIPTHDSGVHPSHLFCNLSYTPDRAFFDGVRKFMNTELHYRLAD